MTQEEYKKRLEAIYEDYDRTIDKAQLQRDEAIINLNAEYNKRLSKKIGE